MDNLRMGWTLAGLQRPLGMNLPTIGPLDYMAMRFGAHRGRIINISQYYREGTFREKVTGSYDWCPLKDEMEVYDWVMRKGYSRNWNRYQKEAFQRLLDFMEVHWGEDGVVEQLNGGLFVYGINNIRVENPENYIYRFYPIGDDFPYRYRTEFTRLEGMLIDRDYHCQWQQRFWSECGK